MRLLLWKCLWRAALPALAVAALVTPGSEARALPLPPGLEGNCTITGCAGAHYDADNGHYYAFVAADAISWADARSIAVSSNLGTGYGYLATVTDLAENTFITGLLP